MKYRTTQKEIRDNYCYIISCSYCGLQTLLQYENPESYTCGTYGWNADIYRIGYNTVIVTGYRPFGKYSVDYDTSKKYEKIAEDIIYHNDGLTYEEKREKLREALKALASEVIGND